MHLGALGLVAPATAEPSATAVLEEPAALGSGAACPTAATWPTSEAPASMNVQLKIGTMQLMYTARDTNDRDLQDRMTRVLPWLAEVMAACEANYEARKQAEDKAKAAPSMPPERTLDEQIAAAVQAAMQAQTAASRDGARTPASSEEHATLTAATHDKDPGWCPTHQVSMRWHEGNARGPGWFSHQLADGSYCKGK